MNLKISHNKSGHSIKPQKNGSTSKGTIASAQYKSAVTQDIQRQTLSMAPSRPDPVGSPDAKRGIID